MLNRLRRLFKKILKIILIPALFLLAMTVFAYFFLAEMLELDKRIPTLLANKLGVECHVEKVHIIFLPKPGILLSNTLILPPGETLAANAHLINASNRIDSIIPENVPTAPSHPTATSYLEIRQLAVYLDIPKLFNGEFKPDGLGISGLSLNLSSPGELPRITRDILEKLEEEAAPGKNLRLHKSPTAGHGAQSAAVIVEESSTETIVRLWNLLKKVSFSEAGVFVLNPDGKYAPLLEHINLKEFFGTMSLSFDLNIPIDDTPYMINTRLSASNFSTDFNSLDFDLAINAEDKYGFDAGVKMHVRHNDSTSLVILDDLLLKTGKSVLSADLTLDLAPKTPENQEMSWQLKGPAQLVDFDLPRWVSPLTAMSAETQTMLSQITGSLELEFSPKGIFLNNINVHAGPYPWQGNGKILMPGESPQLGFYLKTPELPLEVVFPALCAPDSPPRFSSPAPQFLPPHFLSGEIGNTPPVELVLEVDTLLLRTLKIGGFKAEMHNRPLDVHWKLSATDLAGGLLETVILDNDDYTLVSEGTLSSVNIAALLAGMGWEVPVNGLVDLEYNLEGPTATPEDFLQNLRLNLKADGKNLLLAAQGKTPNRSKRNFNLFEKMHIDARLEGQNLQAQNANARLLISGKINASQQTDELKLQVKGEVSQGLDNKIELPGLSLDGEISSRLAFLGFNTRQTGKINGKVKYSEAGNNCTINIDELEFAGIGGKAEINGNNLNNNPKISGKLNLTTKNLRKFLSAMEVSGLSVPEPLLREAELKTQFTSASKQNGNSETYFQNLELRLDYMHFQGEARYDPENKTRIELTANAIDLDAYFPDKKKDAPQSPAAPWPVDDWLNNNFELTLTTPYLMYMKLPNENLKLSAIAGKGQLQAELTATICGGTFNARLNGHSQNNALISDISARLEHASLEQITLARSGEVSAAGDLELSLDIHGKTRSSDDIPAAFNGQWAFNIGKGYFVRSKTSGPAGNREGPMQVNFDFVKGNAKMQSGVLITDDLLMRGPSAHMAGNGKVDLVNKQIDIVMDLSMGGVAFPITLSGEISNPKVNLRGGKFVTNNLTNIGGGLIDLIGGVITLPIKLIELGTE